MQSLWVGTYFAFIDRVQAIFRRSEKLGSAAFKRGRDADDQGEVRHVSATFNLTPMRPFHARSPTDILLRFLPGKPNGTDNRAERLGWPSIIRLTPFRPSGLILALLHWQKRRLSLAATTG